MYLTRPTARGLRRCLGKAVLCATLATLVAPLTPALAAQVALSGSSLHFDAAPGEANRVTVTLSSGVFTVTEPGATLSAGAGCTKTAVDRATCPSSGIVSASFSAGDLDDTVTVTGNLGMTVDGGSGDDTINGGSGADTLLGGRGADSLGGGSGNDLFPEGGGTGADSLAGGSGADWASYSDREAAVTVDLDDAADDGAAGEGDNVRSDVENLEGGDGTDTLEGDISANYLRGRAGDDALSGAAGDDSFDGGPGGDSLTGGSGRDLADYSARTYSLEVDLDGNADDGEAGEQDDVGSDVERVFGGSAGDRLAGAGGDEELRGNSGDDRLEGGDGADVFSGGGGIDTVSYSDHSAGVRADVDGVADDGTTNPDGSSSERDNIGTDVNVVVGGPADDRITGNGSANTLHGGGGDDVLAAGSGNDTLDGGYGHDELRGDGNDDVLDGGAGGDVLLGGSGTDTADYSERSATVIVDIDDRADDGEPGEGDDARTDVERVTGGAGDDALEGDGDTNTLSGGPGGDFLEGGGGRDTLDGGSGDDRLDGGWSGDTLIGGEGIDLADYSARTSGVSVDIDNGADDAGEGDNVRTDVEDVAGGGGSDRITGDSDRNRISGGRGNDTLDGGRGDDAVEGGTGEDTLRGGDNDDTLTGGEDDDDLDGGSGADHVDGGDDDDRLRGGSGSDRLLGGPGGDRADYTDRRGDLVVSLDGAPGDGEPGENDNVEPGVERLEAGSGDDRLIGSDGTDELRGNNGDDVLVGRGGADSLSGGGGSDWADYSDRLAPVVASLDGHSGDGEPGEDDRIASDVEHLRGGAAGDRLAGSGRGNVLDGGPGDDVLDGGGDGDRLEGGDGFDVADYSARDAAVTVNLISGDHAGQEGEGDDVAVEGAVGGAGSDKLTGNAAANVLVGGRGRDTIQGLEGDDLLQGNEDGDRLVGGGGLDHFEAGPGGDSVGAKDGKKKEHVSCGQGRDSAKADRGDRLKGCEGKPTPDKPPPSRGGGGGGTGGRPVGARTVSSRGRFVPIPGFPGERIDSRLVRDIRYLVRKYKIHITDGYALSGHAADGEHPRGLAIDIVPGAGGTWNDVDRLAKWAEPRQNRPRAPFRWVGYNGDANHGRGHHLHLSWNHAATARARPARWVAVMRFKRKPPPRVRSLTTLAFRSNGRIGRVPSVRSGVKKVPRCSGAAPLERTWKAAGKAFNIRWKILAAITKVESGFGCNMGPSSAGAIGWTQFMPATWRGWGMDADGDGKASPYNSVDAIFSSARYLRANGAPGNYRRALFAYNHADWYVRLVLREARTFRREDVLLAPAPDATALAEFPGLERVQTP